MWVPFSRHEGLEHIIKGWPRIEVNGNESYHLSTVHNFLWHALQRRSLALKAWHVIKEGKTANGKFEFRLLTGFATRSSLISSLKSLNLS